MKRLEDHDYGTFESLWLVKKAETPAAACGASDKPEKIRKKSICINDDTGEILKKL